MNNLSQLDLYEFSETIVLTMSYVTAEQPSPSHISDSILLGCYEGDNET